MDPYDIMSKLNKIGYSQTKIAEDLNITQGAVGSVIHGNSKSKMIQGYISELLGIGFDFVWPEDRKNLSEIKFNYEKQIRKLKRRIIELENGV